jgi:hypothetical protein
MACAQLLADPLTAECSALLTLQNALPHLHHFCATLGSNVYVDLRPQYKFEEAKGGGIIAEVTLPLSVDPAFRITKGLESWKTERMAMKDASFEAYHALHTAGLVNDNLLPSRQEADEQAAEFQIPDNTPSLIPASQTLDPWVPVAKHQQQNPFNYYCTLLQLTRDTQELIYMTLLTPVQMPEVPDITLYWNESSRITVKCFNLPKATFSDTEIAEMRTITRKLLRSAFHRRMPNDRDDFLWLLIPSDASAKVWSHTRLLNWNTTTDGTSPALELIRKGNLNASKWGVISVEGDARSYIPQTIVSDTAQPIIQATRVPKRRDFLHVVPESNQKNEAYSKTEELVASTCVVANLPSAYSTFALLVPSIMYRFETHIVGNALRTTLLAPLGLGEEHLSLLVQSVTASVTGEEANYQRYVLSHSPLSHQVFCHVLFR